MKQTEKMERDLTSGSVWKTIFYFTLPYFLSYFLQTLYGMADLFIIGQFQGVDGITAVSNGSQIMHMLTVMIVGLAMGTTVMVGRAVGAKKSEDASEVIGNTVTLFLALSLILMVGLVILVKPIVTLIGTPAEAIEGTVQYLTICFIGIPFITAYNIISSIFRGLGDSRSPMYFIAVACGANIVLDYLLIGVLHMGPSGAALGTTLSQTLSVIISLIAVKKKPTGIRIKKQNFIPKMAVMGQILQIGIPVAVQDGCIQVAFMIITVIANNRGLNDAAVILLGAQYLRGYIWDTIFAGVHFSFTGYFCAYGKSYIGFLHNILAITLVRVPGAYLASLYFPENLFPMGIAAPAGSFLSVLICLIAYVILKKKGKLA